MNQKGNNTCATVAYPRAEWSPACDILMHTPGQELFDGVIHPSAALFEDYFDVNQAAAEHRQYIRMLEANGIKVHTVSQILRETDIENLRTLAEKMLTYDISHINEENPDASENYRQYVLSKMSRADLISCILRQPTVTLYKTDLNTGYEAVYSLRPLINLYFTRDQSITTPRGHVICKMNSSQRAPETEIIAFCYEHLGQKPILRITGEGRLEGGDYIPAGDMSLIGCGMRTNDEGIRQLMEADTFGHDTIVVVRDHKFWQMQMHLDTYFNVIDRDLYTMVESRLYAEPGSPEFVTCDVYEREAKGSEREVKGKGNGNEAKGNYVLKERDLSFVDFIRKQGYEIIPINHEDEMHYANNFLTIEPRHIMAVGRQSMAYYKAMADAGVMVEWIPLESLINGYGAAHCMTQVLRRVSSESRS